MSLHLCIGSRWVTQHKAKAGEFFDYAVYIGPTPRRRYEHLNTPAAWHRHGMTLIIPRTRLQVKDIEALEAFAKLMNREVVEKDHGIVHNSPASVVNNVLMVCDDTPVAHANVKGLIVAPAVALVIMAAKSKNPLLSAESLKKAECDGENFEPDLRTIYLGDKVLRMDGKLIESYRAVFHDDRPPPLIRDVL